MEGVPHALPDTIWLDRDAVVVPVDHPAFEIVHDQNNAASRGERKFARCKRGDAKFWEDDVGTWEGRRVSIMVQKGFKEVS